MNTQKNFKRRTAAFLALVLAVSMMAIPMSASAAVDSAKVIIGTSGNDPTSSQYSPPLDFNGGGSSSSSSSLPFTGLDVLALVGAALVLTGSGLLIRRLSTSGGEGRS